MRMPKTTQLHHSPPKHHKKVRINTTTLKDVKGFKELSKFRGTKTRTSENSQLQKRSNVIKIARGIIPPIQHADRKP